MKRSFAITGLGVALVLVLFSGIYGTSSATTLAAATTGSPALLRAYPIQSEGQEILERACVVCHDLGGIDEFQAAYDEDSLRELIATMVSYGAQISDNETDILVAYLSGNEVQGGTSDFDEVAARELVTTSCTTCHDLTGIERGLYPAEEWRETINRMMGYGLNVSAEEVETIVMYLGTAPVQVADNVEPVIDVAAGADLVTARCSTCHDLTGIEPGLYPADEWRETVGRMLGYGLNLSDEEFELVVNYLGGSPAEDNSVDVATIDVAAGADLVTARCSTCHDLTGIEPGLYPADEWRETVGRMLGYGLSISDDELELIVTYLGSSDAVNDDGYDAVAAESLLNGSCTTCHDLSAITSEPGTYTEAGFRETIERMLGYGLILSNDEIGTLVRFLTETYGVE